MSNMGTTNPQTAMILTDVIDWPSIATNSKELAEWLDNSDVAVNDPKEVETMVELLTEGHDVLMGLFSNAEDASGPDDEAYLSKEEMNAYWDAAWSLRDAADDLKELANSTDPTGD
jgi:hypothetical protein